MENVRKELTTLQMYETIALTGWEKSVDLVILELSGVCKTKVVRVMPKFCILVDEI